MATKVNTYRTTAKVVGALYICWQRRYVSELGSAAALSQV